MIRSSVPPTACSILVILTGLVFLAGAPGMLAPTPLQAGTKIQDDPKGFQGIPWGSPLNDVPGLTLAESTELIPANEKGTILIKGYDFQNGPPHLGQAALQYMRFFTIDGRFARVTIRYQGEQNHKELLAYLQSRFGPLERPPGSMMRGLSQHFNWRGKETEVNLTYDGFQERGHLFIESRILAPKFSEGYSDRAF